MNSNKKGMVKKEIPIFFTTDDNYLPFLDVAISSLIENASKEYRYRIIVLNTGLNQDKIKTILKRQNEDFRIDFVDISKQVENIKAKFKNVYHFSIVTYYRLFIASMFPEYDKVLYLDCDLIVLGDVSKLYNIELGENILGASLDQYVQITDEFKLYAEKAIGVNPSNYVNAGVMLINLKEFRKSNIEEKFIELITKYNFDLVDPDQAYLNYLCREKIFILPNGWNKASLPTPCEGQKNIVHYNLYKKPWQYDDVINGEHFWSYAQKSPFYKDIIKAKNSFTSNDATKNEQMAKDIIEHALRLVNSNYTFAKMLNN